MAIGVSDNSFEGDAFAIFGFKSGDLCKVVKSSSGFVVEPGFDKIDPKRTLYGGPGQRITAIEEGDIVLVITPWKDGSVIVSKGTDLCLIGADCIQLYSEGMNEPNE